MKTKNLRTNRIVDKSKYVNHETAEPMGSEKGPNINVTESESTNKFRLESDDFVAIESAAFPLISGMLYPAEQMRFYMMTAWLKTEHNIVFNHSVPHTPDTLSKAIGLDKSNTGRLIKKLVSSGFMAHEKCPASGYRQKLYIINPIIARKRSIFNKDLQLFFKVNSRITKGAYTALN